MCKFLLLAATALGQAAPVTEVVPVTAPQVDLKEADKALNSGDWKKAEILLTQSIEQSDSWQARHLRGAARMNGAKRPEALLDFDKAVELGGPSSVLISRAKARASMRRFEAALADCDKAEKDGEKSDHALREIRIARYYAYSGLDKLDVAVEQMTANLVADPTDFTSLHLRGNAFLRWGKPENALADYDKALDINPGLPEVIASKSQVHQQRQEYDKAHILLLEITRFKNPTASAFNNAAWFWSTCPDDRYRQGAKAVQFATKACEMTEWKDAMFLDTLAAAYAESGDFAQAIRWQKQAMTFPLFAKGSDAEDARRRLDSYQNGKPWQDHPVTDP